MITLRRTATALAPLFLLSTSLAADVFVLGGVLSEEPQTVEDLVAADLDGDGDLDLLSASSGDDLIAWFENLDGQGTFGGIRVVDEGADYAYSVAAEDFDGDGDLDVLAASLLDDTVAWYENTDGLGSFGAPRVIALTSDEPRDAHAADLDGDGDVDVLVASSDDGKVAWFENLDGLGNFGAEDVLDAGLVGAQAVLPADVDGDGDTDVLAAATTASTIVWYENLDGLGGFGAAQTVALTTNQAPDLGAADLDGDGDLDVFSRANSQPLWVENTGGGAFGAPQLFFLDFGTVFALDVDATDLDGDGDLDLLTSGTYYGYSCALGWNRNLGGGVFAPWVSLTAAGGQSLLMADLDGDGDPDAASEGCFAGVVWIENTDGLGALGGEHAIVPLAQGPRALATADLDGDGDLDALAASELDDRVSWFENTDGLGGFELGAILTAGADRAQWVRAADLDGDADPDVLYAAAGDDEVGWLRNADGLGTFGGELVIGASAGALRVEAADVDLDGDLDALSAAGFAGMAWHENLDGVGTFGTPNALPGFAEALAPADVDGDGDVDVVTARSNLNRVAWHAGDGAGGFGPEQVIANDAQGASDVLAADLDGDLDLDVAAAARNGSKVVWYRNAGAGAFGAEELVTSSLSGAATVFASDLDGDADLDLIAGGQFSDAVEWYANSDGLGSFGPAKPIVSGTPFPTSARAADLDGDGDADVLVADAGTNEIAWYANTPCAASAPATVSVRAGTPPNPTVLAVAGGPVVGTSWEPSIDHTSFVPFAAIDVLAVSNQTSNLPTAAGTVLCGLTPLVTSSVFPGNPFPLVVPADCQLVGVALCAQGAALSLTGEVQLTNALDTKVGTF
ncbi:MAG: VCBS repeat-containing protein [Planctomycetota bacterium]